MFESSLSDCPSPVESKKGPRKTRPDAADRSLELTQTPILTLALNRHAALILCITRYAFSWIRFNYYGGVAQFCYRFAFIAAASTYGIVVYKTWRARQKTGAKQPGGPLGYLSDENIQYLCTSLMPAYLAPRLSLLTGSK